MDVQRKAKIDAILTAAAAAPSGDNSQPWRFVVREQEIDFHYLPEKDNELLNHEEGGTLIALGAAIANAELEAYAQGYTPHITFHDTGACVATMALHAGGTLSGADAPLREAILKRHTNRKAYAVQPLPDPIRAGLLSPQIVDAGEPALVLVESRSDMKVLARALTTMEEIALSTEALHKLFFGDIFWSDEDNRAGHSGLHIKTLELPPPAQALFKVLRHWSVTRALSRIGFHKAIANMNATQNASASAFGIITAVQTGRDTYLKTGRLLERAWLFAVAHGLSLQIVTGVTFLARSLATPSAAAHFSVEAKESIAHAYERIRAQAGAGRIPVLVFRIGEGGVPTEVSYRRAPEATFTV